MNRLGLLAGSSFLIFTGATLPVTAACYPPQPPTSSSACLPAQVGAYVNGNGLAQQITPDNPLPVTVIASGIPGNTVNQGASGTQAWPVFNAPGSGAALGISPVTSTSLEVSGCKVLKPAPGNAYVIGVTNGDSAQDYLMVANTSGIPASGAFVPALPPLIVAANGGYTEWASNGTPPPYFSSGITACLSSTSGFTFTPVVSKGIFTGEVQ